MTVDAVAFRNLMGRIATGWSTQNTELALSAFVADAVYMEPPDIQLYHGHEELRLYFDALDEGHYLHWHLLWFDEESRTGGGEFVFGVEGKAIADHGVAVVELTDDGLIAVWREYQRKGPADMEEFLAVEGKQWQWHIGNYP